MPLPLNISKVTVHGKVIQSLDGDAAPGSITFSVPLLLKDPADGSLLTPDSITVPIGSDGIFTVLLPATDDPDVDPVGWTYVVNENWAGGRSGLRVSLPAALVNLDWINMVPSSTPGAGGGDVDGGGPSGGGDGVIDGGTP